VQDGVSKGKSLALGDKWTYPSSAARLEKQQLNLEMSKVHLSENLCENGPYAHAQVLSS
jgi:hypothetical protein